MNGVNRWTVVVVAVLVAVLAIGLGGCDKPASVTLHLDAAPRDFSFTFGTNCSLASDEGCRASPAAGGVVEFTPSEEARAGECSISLVLLEVCDAVPLLLLLEAATTVEVLNSTEAVDVTFGPDDFFRYDDDVDGYSNWLEWSEGTDPRDSAAVPEGDRDL